LVRATFAIAWSSPPVVNGPLTTQMTPSRGFAQSALRGLSVVLRDVETTSVGAIPPPTSAWPVGRL